MKDSTLIITAAGGCNNLLSVQLSLSSDSMLPINGKPVIGWSIANALSKNITNIIILTSEKTHAAIKQYVSLAFKYSDISVICIKSVSVGDTIRQGLKLVKTKKVFILFGDTIYLGEYSPSEENFLFYRTDYVIADRWCSVSVDSSGFVLDYIDKESYSPSDKVVSGFFLITDLDKFRQTFQSETDLYKALSNLRLKAYENKMTFDCGHFDNYYITKTELFRTRFFNSIEYDPKFQILTKKSRNEDKIIKEINWYLNIPATIKNFVPRLVDYSYSPAQYKLEYYGYNTLMELHISNSLQMPIWEKIVNKLLDIHQIFKEFKSERKNQALIDMYINKTEQRIQEIKNPVIKGIIQKSTVTINGTDYNGFFEIRNRINRIILNYISGVEYFSVIHGDLCFANILFDLNSQIFKLIDPRGDFGGIGIFGDPLYDIAKLRHSIHGHYDYIVSDLFRLETIGDSNFEFHVNSSNEELENYFDSLLSKKYNLEDIKLLEGLLFISMIPLHNDSEQRQLAMYLTGIRLLNEVIK